MRHLARELGAKWTDRYGEYWRAQQNYFVRWKQLHPIRREPKTVKYFQLKDLYSFGFLIISDCLHVRKSWSHKYTESCFPAVNCYCEHHSNFYGPQMMEWAFNFSICCILGICSKGRFCQLKIHTHFLENIQLMVQHKHPCNWKPTLLKCISHKNTPSITTGYKCIKWSFLHCVQKSHNKKAHTIFPNGSSTRFKRSELWTELSVLLV